MAGEAGRLGQVGAVSFVYAQLRVGGKNRIDRLAFAHVAIEAEGAQRHVEAVPGGAGDVAALVGEAVDVGGAALVRGNIGTVWQIAAGENTTSLTIPAPPSPVDPAETVGTMFLTGYLSRGTVHWDSWLWTRWTRAESVRLQP